MMRKTRRFFAAAKLIQTAQARGDCQKVIKEYQKTIPKPIRKRIDEDILLMENSEGVRKAMRYIFFVALAHHEMGVEFSFGESNEEACIFDSEVLDMYCEGRSSLVELQNIAQA